MDLMGTVTLNVSDEVETIFRKTSKNHFGVGKGKLKQAFEEAIVEWARHKERDAATQKLLDILEKGIPIGFKPYRHRDELYDRTI